MIEIEKILEKQRAWQDASANDESLMSAMALESLSKCAEAVAILSENLRKIGYSWISAELIPENELERINRYHESLEQWQSAQERTSKNWLILLNKDYKK